jgi:hypothetical protein
LGPQYFVVGHPKNDFPHLPQDRFRKLPDRSQSLEQ